MPASSVVRGVLSGCRAGVAVYRPYVEQTAITFETDAPTPELSM